MNLTLKSSFVVFVLALQACAGCEVECDDCTPGGDPAFNLIELAKRDLAKGDYAAALQKCLKAEERDDASAEAKYCVLLSQVGALSESVSAILGLIATQLDAPPNPPAFAKDALRVKPIISSILSDLESQMQYIDRYSYKLAAMDNPHFHIDDFPLRLDPKDLLTLVGSGDVQVTRELRFNMRGTWDKSEVMVLGATINAGQGILDYVLAHKLVLASTDINFDTTSGVADFLHSNPDLLGADVDDNARIKGDGDKHKGLKNDVLAALSFLVGRASDLELVAPKNNGLLAAIKASAAESGTYTDQVVKWVGVDAKGIPTKVGLPAINDIKNGILDADGQPLITGDTLDNPFKSETWLALVEFIEALRDNVEMGGDAVGLRAPLQAIVIDLAAGNDNADLRLLGKPVPDLLAVNPGVFLMRPTYLAGMLPYYFTYTIDGITTVYDLALEEEHFDPVSALSYFYVAGTEGDVTQPDWDHFAYTSELVVKSGFTMKSFAFDDFDTAPDLAEADGVTATAKTPHLYYIALQDPSLGGFLEADVAFGGSYETIADNQTFNKGLNELVSYYCLDFNVTDGQTGHSLLDVIDDAKYPADNKIAACH